MGLIQHRRSTEDVFNAPLPLPHENVNNDGDFLHDHEEDHHGSEPDKEPHYDDYGFDPREGCCTFYQKCLYS